jgi:mRNA-degrading endonuclease RelE of RelBE toxin-antitoxin system
MSYRIKVLPWCSRQLKKLRKKYPQIKNDLENLGSILTQSPESGDRIPGLDVALYKIRMRSCDQKKGKRGGYRVIYYFKGENSIIYLVDIYAKVDREEFSREEVLKTLKEEGLL